MIAASAQNPRVIVGVDDTPAARWVLAWAIGEARLRHDPLLIVHVESLPRLGATAVERLDPNVIAGLRSAGAQLIARLLDEVSGGPPPGVPTSAMSLVGDAGAALVRITRPGDLLVVGHSDRGWLSRLSRPSVQRHCTRHVAATLTCVRPPLIDGLDEPPDDGPAGRTILRRLRQRRRSTDGSDREHLSRDA